MKLFLFLVLCCFEVAYASRPAVQGSMDISNENGTLVFHNFVLRDMYKNKISKDYVFRLESFYIIDTKVPRHPENKMWGIQSVYERYAEKFVALPEKIVMGVPLPDTQEDYPVRQLILGNVYTAMGHGLVGEDSGTLYQPFCLIKSKEGQDEVILLEDSSDECKPKRKWFFGLF
jgi:hypothetical protein